MKIYEIFQKTYTVNGHRFDSLGLYHTEQGAKEALKKAVYTNLWKCDTKEEVEKEVDTVDRLWLCYNSNTTGVSIRMYQTKD